MSKDTKPSKALVKTAVIVRLSTFQKAEAASKWSKERSEGNRDVDRECYYDFLMGMEEAERLLLNAL